MIEQEAKAIKWMKNIRDDAVATMDHIAKNEPKVSPMLYAGRKEKADVLLKMFEELEQYRALGTLEELREAREKQVPKKPEIEGDGCDKEGNIIYDTWICPNCGMNYEVDYDEYDYCPQCGQAINRSEEN